MITILVVFDLSSTLPLGGQQWLASFNIQRLFRTILLATMNKCSYVANSKKCSVKREIPEANQPDIFYSLSQARALYNLEKKARCLSRKAMASRQRGSYKSARRASTSQNSTISRPRRAVHTHARTHIHTHTHAHMYALPTLVFSTHLPGCLLVGHPATQVPQWCACLHANGNCEQH